MKAILALGALAALLALPTATAVISTGDQYEAFQAFVDAFAPNTADLSMLPVLYMDDNGNLWQESNGLEGLQTEETPVEGAAPIAADTAIGGFGTIAIPSELPALPQL